MKTQTLFSVCWQRSPDADRQRTEIEALLRDGANLHETDKNGVTPLHCAVRFRSPMAVETLIGHGADVNQQCKRSGSTPLHRAVTSTGAPGTAGKDLEGRKIVEILLRAGADASIGNKKGKRAIDYVRDPEIRKLLCGKAVGTRRLRARGR